MFAVRLDGVVPVALSVLGSIGRLWRCRRAAGNEVLAKMFGSPEASRAIADQSDQKHKDYRYYSHGFLQRAHFSANTGV